MVAESSGDATGLEKRPMARNKITVLVIAVVAIVAALSVTALVLLSTPQPSAAALDRVEILDAAATIDQGQSMTVRARAVDTAGADRTTEATFAWSASPPNVLRVTGLGSQVTLAGLDVGDGTVTVVASWRNATKQATADVAVNALVFQVTASDLTPVVGDPVDLTIRVMRGTATATTYRGTVTFSSDVPSRVVLPADATFTTADSGVKTVAGLEFTAFGTATITASDTLVSIEGGLALRGRARPVPSFLVEGTERVGADIRVDVDAAASNDPDGSIAAYNWSWGDTTSSETTTPQASHVYSASYEDQTVTVVLRTTDDEGLTATFSRDIRVTLAPIPPTASFEAVGPDPRTWSFRVDAGASSDPNGNLAYYNWTWGDGQTAFGTSPVATHRYPDGGTYTINLTVEDLTGLKDWAELTVRAPSLDYEFYDFFNVPYGEWWDKRAANYWELPVNAECFNATSVAAGWCTPFDASVDDVLQYPYMHFYSPGNPGNPNLIPSIWAPYRMRVQGTDVPGYTLAEPVIAPVLNPSQPAGSMLEFDWYLQYLNVTREYDAQFACGTNFVFGNDGYILEGVLQLTMDLQESRRLFDVSATTPAEAQAWWTERTSADCADDTPFELLIDQWFVNIGGTQATPGKYDIANGYEWYYQSFATNVTATVDPNGTTHVRIDHFSYGGEALMGRWLYWGNASYLGNTLNDTRRAGWWGMENSWFEDFHYRGQMGATGHSFTLNTIEQYHLQELCSPGPNGLYDHVDDIAFWQWGPFLLDYVNDFYPQHPNSEMDRYTGRTYVHCAPGQPRNVYGDALEYDYVPNTWDLRPGESWHFQFPTGDIVVHDPNLTPEGADPLLAQFVEVSGPMNLWYTAPASYGVWDSVAKTWDVTGPTLTGGPAGTPGPDGVPGTADDEYALVPWPQFNFVAGAPPPAPVASSGFASGWVPSMGGPSGTLDGVEWIAILSPHAEARNAGATRPVRVGTSKDSETREG